MANVKRSQESRSEKTRTALIKAARRLFAENGFAATSTEEITTAAEVSRGALYHQFADKSALFLAVFEDVEQDLMKRVAAVVASESEPLAMMLQGCEAFLELSCEPEVRQISLIDAPSVVGWKVWREVDAKYGLGLIRGVLGAMVESDLIEAHRVEDLSHFILGALSEAAMVVGNAPDDGQARTRVSSNVQWMIEGILAERTP